MIATATPTRTCHNVYAWRHLYFIQVAQKSVHHSMFVLHVVHFHIVWIHFVIGTRQHVVPGINLLWKLQAKSQSLMIFVKTGLAQWKKGSCRTAWNSCSHGQPNQQAWLDLIGLFQSGETFVHEVQSGQWPLQGSAILRCSPILYLFSDVRAQYLAHIFNIYMAKVSILGVATRWAICQMAKVLPVPLSHILHAQIPTIQAQSAEDRSKSTLCEVRNEKTCVVLNCVVLRELYREAGQCMSEVFSEEFQRSLRRKKHTAATSLRTGYGRWQSLYLPLTSWHALKERASQGSPVLLNALNRLSLSMFA